MLIPIRAEINTRHPPYMNHALIAANVLIFLFTDVLGGPVGDYLKTTFWLDAAWPALYQYFTYQFLHDDWVHLIGNMLFLWIFGNAVCDRMGSGAYLLFYLAGGVFAAVAFAGFSDSPMLGASGSIAAVTTAFLALYPRVPITMLLFYFLITTFQVQASLLIIFKVILWDNIIAPRIAQGFASNVAYSAHLAGYLFGFLAVMLMLGVRALPRYQFDMLALITRWRRRHGYTGPETWSATRGRPVRAAEVGSAPLQEIELSPTERKRETIIDALDAHHFSTALDHYHDLLRTEPEHVLPRRHQLDIANLLKQQGEYAEAARAYEGFLRAYPNAGDSPQVRLLLGLLYSRYLDDRDRAIRCLEQARDDLTVRAQRELADQEIAHLTDQA